MRPSLELVGIRETESFKLWTHGYPYETVRWHFHPEYEINLITRTSGQFFVGDHTGQFSPGHLCLVGPNVPHNWISDVAPGQTIAERCIVLQFSGKVLRRGIETFPELAAVERLLVEANRGVQFSKPVSARAGRLLRQLLRTEGVGRIAGFLGLLELLAGDGERHLLASGSFRPDPEQYQSSTINQVLRYLAEHLHERIREPDLARYAGMQDSAFSRFFRRSTGVPFVSYLNRLRINRACEMLIETDASIADICYACGFNNLSNFNRQFLAAKAMPPSRFRRFHRLNDAMGLPPPAASRPGDSGQARRQPCL